MGSNSLESDSMVVSDLSEEKLTSGEAKDGSVSVHDIGNEDAVDTERSVAQHKAPNQGHYAVYTDKQKNQKESNYVRTAKYTILTFLPLNLFEQFRKTSNVYFLLNMLVAILPGVSPIFPLTSITALLFVLAAAALKDAFEDRRRHVSDKKANSTLCWVVRSGKLQQVCAHEVQLGDTIKMERGCEFVADAVIISTALENGMCYIETANLDGETNMKPRRAIEPTQHLSTPELIEKADMKITCDMPHPNLVSWQGVLQIHDVNQYSLDLSNIVFRGCKLMNTPWAYGVVVYVGKSTKMMQNLQIKPSKFSLLDKNLNKMVLTLLGIQQCMLLVLAGLSLSVVDTTRKSFYLQDNVGSSNLFFLFVFNYLTFFVLLNFMMPISLFVTLEMCKAVQAGFMEMDMFMKNEDGDGVSAKTSNLNEDLSQIKYIFSDKTGTLTENRMVFAQCAVGEYVHDEAKSAGGIQEYIQRGGPDKVRITDFMCGLALCNTVLCNVEEKTGSIRYEGPSTDEVALVLGASQNGFVLTSHTAKQAVLEVMGVATTYEILLVLDFNSDRKRMSVILRNALGQIILYMKGADSHIMPLMNGIEDPNKCIADLDSMSREGLRTLVFGYKKIPPQDFERYRSLYDKASIMLEGKEEEMAKVAAEIEHDITLLGCTGVEDRLQDQVPETIRFFLDAGIVVWMLTGDKRETAVNIAASSKLIGDCSMLHFLTATNVTDMCTQLEQALSKCMGEEKGQWHTIVIEGESLISALEPNNISAFRQLGELCSSAICCRVTPLQKAQIVATFQKGGKPVLAVGDGANDVSMIQEGKVGIGIKGLEGSQAALASDYAIAQFKHLRRLVAVHGRYSLVRNWILVYYSFYKNLVLSFSIMMYTYHCAFSGQTLFDSWALTLFNMMFTALSPLAMGIFEKDLPDDVVEQDPKLLKELTESSLYGPRAALMWFLSAIFHSLMIFVSVSYSFEQDDTAYERTSDIWTQGTVMLSCVITCVIFKVSLVCRTWTWVMLVAVILSCFGYVLFLIAYSAFPLLFESANYHQIALTIFKDVKFWLWNLFCGIGILIPDFAFMAMSRAWWPTYRDRVLMLISQVRSSQVVPFKA
mmetsp:Transcript_109209/g.189252  ORF Transcript_109209/g.189252 Transcript_109209/m.189252 type:complete len:1098 (-) Transcript_109209:789-4082(-)